MIKTHTPFARAICSVLAFSMTALSFPFHAFALDAKPVKPQPEKPETLDVRVLSAKELRTHNGKLSVDPSVSGTRKTSIVKNGIDLTTGNYTTSANDLSFEGGYGIPVSVSRVYSANNGDEGPFGFGWTLSADVRQTAGGVLKSSQSASISVPTTFRERHDFVLGENQTYAGQIIEAVISIDASGKETTVQRDADGVLTGPAWDKNIMIPEYETVIITSGSTTTHYEVMKKNTVTTPEGTTYVYEKKGYYSYGNGMHPLNNPSGERVPSNVLKVTSVTDRNGNTTYYKYRTDSFTYERMNGTVTENGLDQVWMPDGSATSPSSASTRYIQFHYGQNHGGGAEPSNRISSVTDGTRIVKYYYDSDDALEEVKSPGLKITRYDYTSWQPDSSEIFIPLLCSIRDHRGLTTTINYGTQSNPYGSYGRPSAYKVTLPNGIQTLVRLYGVEGDAVPELLATNVTGGSLMEFQDRRGYVSDPSPGTLLAYGQISYSTTQTPATMTFTMKDYTAYGTGTSQGIPRLSWAKTYNALSLDLLEEARYIQPYHDTTSMSDLSVERHLKNAGYDEQRIITKTDYNFRGNPLRQRVWEQERADYANSYATIDDNNVTSKVYYAYWGPTKYFQQKAVKSFKSNGDPRYSLTDYFESTHTDVGKRGQVYKVYDPEQATFTHTASHPSNTPSEWQWAYKIAASGTHSAEFDYDSQGRPISVKKLKTSAPTYVETTTSYLSGAGHYGYPYEVIEDYGSGKLNRTTRTEEYDVAGRAVEVESHQADGTGHRTIRTYYWEPTGSTGSDGEVENVTLEEGSTFVDLVFNYYHDPVDPAGSGVTESEKINSGMLHTAQDGLTDAYLSYSYVPGNGSTYVGGIGQVASVTDARYYGNTSASYTYTDNGERDVATHVTENGTTKYKYEDYITVGSPESYSRAFQTMNRLFYISSAWVKDGEEYHYQYDTAGRLTESAFAQTRQMDGSTPIPYSTAVAARRARQFNDYDPAGRIKELNTGYDIWGGAAYTPTQLVGVTNSYENWTHLRSQTVYDDGATTTHQFDYDDELGYLVGASYNGGTTWDAWGYDAAGNRISESHGSSNSTAFTYDNLNRMTQSANWNGSSFGTAFSYANDFLGNRVSRGSSTVQNSGYTLYTWDAVNRLVKTVSASNGATFTYRPDGLRADKIKSHVLSWNVTGEDSGYYDEDEDTNQPTTRYYYDGQMTVEEDYLESVVNDPLYVVTQYALGARGIDGVRKYDEINDESWYYPVYDGHGNQIATLSRSGSSFALDNERLFDAWGVVKTGAATGGPSNRYCASIGHQQDDESGLIYMRARYYEPWTGRFVSEDMACDGTNWLIYARNDPVNKLDVSGQSAMSSIFWAIAAVVGSAMLFLGPGLNRIAASPFARPVLLSGGALILIWFFGGGPNGDGTGRGDMGRRVTDFVIFSSLICSLSLIIANVNALPEMHWGREAACTVAAYSIVLLLFMALDTVSEEVFKSNGSSQE